MSASARLYKHSNRLPKYQPLSWSVYFRNILAKDGVMWAALALAAASSAAVRPDPAALFRHVDFHTLACLAALMVASGGFMISGVFDKAAARLVNSCRDSRSLMAAMVCATFFASMFITNDVALIVLVPTTLLACRRAGLDPIMIVVLQTVAANVGSMVLPMGNPQNLYLYSRYAMPFASFFLTVLPLSLAGLAALALFCLFSAKRPFVALAAPEPTIRRADLCLYSAVFVIAAAAIFAVLDYRIAFAVAAVVVAAKGRNLAQQVDYALLLTFVGFFVFVGNISDMPAIAALLREFVEPRPYSAAVAASQIISNVPAAVMLSGFTDDYRSLLAGVSAGGCGTPIASMASLIAYKLVVRAGGSRTRFLLCFVWINALFLAIMTLAHALAAE